MAFSISLGPRVRKSPFFDATVKAGVTGFTIYNHMYMPVSYGDPLAEYWQLINGVSMWDVAAERQVQLEGPDAGRLAQYLTPRNLANCVVGQGKYVPICDHDGVLLNDPVLLKHSDEKYWLSIADSDVLFWARAVGAEKGFDVRVTEPDASPLAIQGPKAEDVVAALAGEWVRKLRYFWFKPAKLGRIPVIIQRSGWSKQGGFEIYLLDGQRGGDLWAMVEAAGKPFGIKPGSPNYYERVESGLLSFGADTLPDTNPLEVGLGRYCDLDQDADFIGKAALIRLRDAGPRHRQVGLFIAGRALPGNEHAYPLMRKGKHIGTVNVIAHSPRLKKNIAIALVPAKLSDKADGLSVALPTGKSRDATITKLPFC